MDYQARRNHLQERLQRRKIDAVLISQPDNRRYLSGFTARDHGIEESSGALLVTATGKAWLLTDSRYQLQAEEETGLPVLVYRKGLVRLLARLLATIDCQRFAFESHYTLHSVALAYAELAEKRRITLIPVKGLVEAQRQVKSEAELSLIRHAVSLNETVFSRIYSELSTGMSETEVAMAIETAMHEAGAEGPSFATIVAAGSNSARPHAVPTTHRIKGTEPITIDMGLILNGYCSDMTRSFTLGPADDRYLTIHRTVRAAQLAGLAAIRPGIPMNHVDRAARKVIEEAGYGRYFGHSLGHGVGLAVHEAPSLSPRNRRILKAGMVVTVEPGIYIPGWGGVRLENMAVVRDGGAELLNHDATDLDL